MSVITCLKSYGSIDLNILIIGYGSIGKRHGRGLAERGSQVSLVTSQSIEKYNCFSTIEKAFCANVYDSVLIANPTAQHQKAIQELIDLNYGQTIFVEKPLFSQVAAIAGSTENIYVTYNLRFSEVLAEVKRFLQNEEIIACSIHAGQYLPSWRAGKKYSDSYSAKKSLGGGVLRDLSHELDYCQWLFGSCIKVAALGGKFSALNIDSDDVYSVLMTFHRCPIVVVHLNYLDRIPKRELIIQTKRYTVSVNLIKGEILVDGQLTFTSTNDILNTYKREHEAMIAGDVSLFCPYDDGLKVVQMIEAIEAASQSHKWMYIEKNNE